MAFTTYGDNGSSRESHFRLQRSNAGVRGVKGGDTGLIHFTQIRPGLSYWWMSLPSMHSLEVASVPFTLVRIMLLVQIITEKRPEALIITGLPEMYPGLFIVGLELEASR